MVKKQKPYIRARTDEHLFEAFRRKMYLDRASASQTITTILSNYFIHNQQYLKPIEQQLIQAQQAEEEEIWNITREWEDQE